MKMGRLTLVCLAVLPALTVLGCQDEEAPRSRLLITRIAETDIEQDTYDFPLLSDVIDAGDDGIIPSEDDAVYEDLVYLTVANQPRSSLLAIDPQGPFGAVVLTGYKVRYEIDGEQLDPLEAGMHLVVPSGSETIARVVVVSALAKTQPPLSTLAIDGGELFATAHVTIYGYEETSEDPVETTADLQIHFANWADED